ncbi:serine kinase [Altererythrobacter sp. HHU K3-1]|uniref:Serine kinase n=1 Tax=Qipengyuania atrilutea TaxID=2744473 RepID=A0A850H8V6_9SPHN|nr:serine kinase [Actirhodobacter atriluteus]
MRLNVSAVAIDGRALILTGKPGSGKSTLALQLIDRGATLIGDDGVAEVSRGGSPVAAPPAQQRGALEIRGVGLVTLTVTEAPAALVLVLDETPERLPDTLAEECWAGIAVPRLPFDPNAPAAALRAEHALRKFARACIREL